jgi:hypothetical protein
MSDKSYGVDYTMEVCYDHDTLDTMNHVNGVLFDAGVNLQFVIEDHEQNADIPSVFYSLLETEELVQE